MNRRVVEFLLFAVVFATGCGSRAPAPSVENTASSERSHEDQVRDALTRLLTVPPEDGGFVIIEDPETGKFVQFGGSSQGLLVDLPRQTLSDHQMNKAAAVFSSRGYAGPTSEPDLNGNLPVFRQEFGLDVDKATELAVALLQQVYGLKEDAPLELTEEHGSQDFSR